MKTYALTLVLVIVFMLLYELYWRGRGFTPAFNDDKLLWADARKKVYKSPDHATVFIGSSRSRFDIDIPTWRRITGEDAIQLAFGGTSPRPILHHLAHDKKFRGKVIIDVAEPYFFSVDSLRTEKAARESLDYFINETPAQCLSAEINFFLESHLVFLEEGRFGLNALLSELPITNREGVFMRTPFPKEFSMLTRERQSKFTTMFLNSPQLRKAQLEARAKTISTSKVVPIHGAVVDSLLQEIKESIDKIRDRGGCVVFIRPPSDGASLHRENTLYPKHEYCDRLLKVTQTAGIHFADYRVLTSLKCVDQSHLSPGNAAVYTKYLIAILKEEPTWRFSKNNITQKGH